jgi:hypothetical protein
MHASTPRVLSRILATTTVGLLVTVLLPGCDESSAGWSHAHVWGRVTSNGKPLDSGSIVFWPANRSQLNWAAGTIKKDGVFVLRSVEANKVLEPGRYTIFFCPPEARQTSPRGLFATEDARAEKVEKPAYPVPAKLTDWQTSDLEVTLSREPSRIDINLRTDR